MKKRILTALLAVCVAFTSVPMDVKAYGQNIEMTEENEAVENEEQDEAVAEQDLDDAEASENQEAAESTTEEKEQIDVTEADGETETSEMTEESKATEASEMTEESETTEISEMTEESEITEASEVTEESEMTETSEVTEIPENTEASEATGLTEVETNITEATEVIDTTELMEDVPENDKVIEKIEEEAEEASALNFIMVASDYIETPGTQKVIASIGDGEAEAENVLLTYRNSDTKEEFKAEASDKIEDMVLFELDFDKDSQTGTYELLTLTYTLEDEEYTIDLLEEKMDIRFGVNKEVETNPDQFLVEEGAETTVEADVEANVVKMDENGNVVSETTVEDVLGSGIGEIAALDLGNTASTTATTNDDLVVVLDAGHDSTHGNANSNSGHTEAELVLKIAMYCKAELETYSGVKVYMTRTTAACPYGAGITARNCLEKRAEYAKSVNADVLVSLHLNALTYGSANGAEVYYPNSNYNQKIGEDGKALAEDIIKKLEALGIKARGIYTKNAQTDKYPDGSVADYYTLMRECKNKGILAVIVEHAFLKDSTDYENFLNSEEKLKKLGVADAEAIAECYGLTKKSAEKPKIKYTQSRSDGTIKVKWAKVSNATSYEVYRKEKDSVAAILIGTTTETSFIDKKVTVGTKYYYQVKAIYSNGAEGKISDSVAGRALKKTELKYVKSKSSKKMEISWKKVSNASGYYVYRRNESTGKYEQIAKIESGTTTTYIDKVEKNNTKYKYKVQAYNVINGVEGVGAASEVKAARTIAKASIKSVAATNDKTLEISWKKVDGATGYIVSRSTKKNSGFKEIATVKSGKTTSYKDTTVKSGVEYYYKVEAYRDDAGQRGYGGKSNAVVGKTIEKTSISHVISKDCNTLEIKWKKIDGAWGYNVKRSTSANGKYETIATVKGRKNNIYKDETVKTDKTYYYKIEVISEINGTKNYSGNSKAVSGKTLNSTTIKTITTEKSKKITLTWKKVSGVTGYQIYRSTSKNGTYEKIATVKSAKTTSYTDTSVKAGKTYYYKIRTYKKNGEKTDVSSYSAKQKAKTVKKAAITKISGTSGEKVTLNWDKVSNADGYRIFRSTKETSGFKCIAEIDKADTVKYTDKTVKAGEVYYYKIAATVNGVGNTVGRGDYSEIVEVPVLEKVKISSITLQEGNALKVKWKASNNADGYELVSSSKKDGEYSLVKKTSSKSYTHKNLNEGVTYYYKVRAYKKLSNGCTVYSAWSNVKEQSTGHTIMGESNLTVDEMVKYYEERFTYPADTYKDKGAKNAKKFFTILKEEAEAEGVKTEVLFAQVILETGGLQFGGDVKPDQCNFGGLGATGGGVGGENFKTVRLGLRAQVQHLKAYASNDALNNKCVDTRFEYVKRNTAPYIEWLSIPNNPYGVGWAMDKDYAAKLLSIINKL